MAGISFQERFKNRTAIISTIGNLFINSASPVAKPKRDQLHDSLLKYTGSNVIKSSLSDPTSSINSNESSNYGSEVKVMSQVPTRIKRHYKTDKSKIPKHQQPIPTRKKSNSSLDGAEIINKSNRKVEFKPYTLKDYNNIKPKSYYLLGGLGPSNIGTEDWTRKKDQNNRRWSYGKDIYYANAAKIPLFSPNSPIKIQTSFDSSRTKAIDFAKNIVRPRLRTQLKPSGF